MSSTCSASSADSVSDSSEQECEPSPSARSTPIADESSPSTGPASPAMTTFALFPEIDSPPMESSLRLWPTPRPTDVAAGRSRAQGEQERRLWSEPCGSGIDLICGGFPCQDISNAGKRAGIGGERSGLWSEYARLVGEIRPSYVIVENVAALLGRGLERVLGDLAAL